MDAHPPRHAMALRAVEVAAIATRETLRTVPAALVLLIAGSRPRARRYAYRGFVRGLQALGPTFVKFGQIGGTRTDALPAELCRELARLHDAVAPMSASEAAQALSAAGALRPEIAAAQVDPDPVGSGSIACVYRATLPDGRVVALKLKRLGIDRRMRCDLALLQALVAAGQRLPKLRGMPIADLVGYLSATILGQLDFAREARHSAQMRECLSSMPNVTVPRVLTELSTSTCLVFDFVPDLDADTPTLLTATVRARLGAVALAAVNTLFFEHGLVHCDLHPGNLYVTRSGEVVILDAGYCAELDDRTRELMGEFFMRLALGDGRRCGEIVLDSAVAARGPVDAERFISEVEALVARAAGPANTFDMSTFGDALYDLQQRHGIYAASDFAFPLMSLLVVEGTVRGLSSDIDFQTVGRAAA
jgi:ubiquinone biosynthesis protein